jgi:hypothetical protein
MIEVSEQSINKIHALLAGIQDADEKVLKPAITRGLMAGKTAAGREIRRTYHISAEELGKRGFMKYENPVKKDGGIIGTLMYSGAVIPLIKFKVSPQTPKNGVTPSAAVLKASSLVSFSGEKNVFVGQTQAGHTGVFQREEGKYSTKRGTGKNKHTESIRQLYAPPAPKMMGNEQVIQAVEDRVNEVINQRIDHEIERLLNNY